MLSAAIYAEKRARIEALVAQHDYADAGHSNANPQIPSGVSGAIANERATGLPAGGKWHTQKGSDILGRLKKELKSADNSCDMSDCDKKKLHDLGDSYVRSLQNALNTPMKTT